MEKINEDESKANRIRFIVGILVVVQIELAIDDLPASGPTGTA